MIIDERDARGFPKRWTGQAATGTNQATAFPLLDGGYHEFTTVGSGSGVGLPVVMPWSREVTVSNNGANALLIYPPDDPSPGGTIDNGSVNTPVSLAVGSSATYWATSSTNWQSRVTGGTGGSGFNGIFTPQADPASPVVGQTWFSTNAGGLATCRFVDGAGNRLVTLEDGTFFRGSVSDTPVTGTSLVTLLSNFEASWGSLVIPGGYPQRGQSIEIDLQLNVSATGALGLQFAVFLGTTRVLLSTSPTATASTGIAGFSVGPITLSFTASGSSGSVFGGGLIQALSVQNFLAPNANVGSGPIAVDFSTSKALDVQAAWNGTGGSVQAYGINVRVAG